MRIKGRAAIWQKQADRYVGIPLVWLLGLCRKKRSKPQKIERIGVLKEAGIGDNIVLQGPLQDLRQQYPKAEIILIVGASNAALAKMITQVDQVVTLSFKQVWQDIKMLRGLKLDVLLDAGPWPRYNALLSGLAGCYSVGFATAGQYRHYTYDGVVVHQRQAHEIDNYRALMAQIGVKGTALPQFMPQIPVPFRLSQPAVVCHIGASGALGYHKEWPAAHWITLIQWLREQGFEVYLTGTLKDQAKVVAVAQAFNEGVHDVVGQCSLPQTLSLLAQMQFVVSVNTGIMHLAAAAGVPVVALNGPVSGKRWGPLGKRCINVDNIQPGCGYLYLGFEYRGQRHDCMAQIMPQQVIEGIKTLLC